MKRILFLILGIATVITACNEKTGGSGLKGPETMSSEKIAVQNIKRAMQIADMTIESYFGETMSMSRYYNPYTKVKSSELGSVWMYTSAIEATNAILHSLTAVKDVEEGAGMYEEYFDKYKNQLARLYEFLGYYEGTFTLTSYTQTKEWSAYGVNRGSTPGAAGVVNELNVYDDQQWLIRELFEAFRLTGENKYLERAESLTEYVLDGWDCTLDPDGNENGGITWGPGYTTKHSCSNGPFISPLVWLSEYYSGKDDMTEYRYIEAPNRRVSKQMKKSEYYLMFAKKVYDFQKTHLINSDGVYYDMLGGPSGFSDTQIHKLPQNELDRIYETVDGQKYKAYLKAGAPTGDPLSYNSGTMLSGAADLYRVTKDATYLEDLTKLTDNSFAYFAKLGETRPDLYTYNISGFNNWFNGVLLRGYVDVYPYNNGAALPIDSFQQNLDYGYSNYLYSNLLPVNLLLGWGTDTSKINVEGMFEFAFAAEYAVMAKYLLEN